MAAIVSSWLNGVLFEELGKRHIQKSDVRFLLEAHELGYGIGLSFIHEWGCLIPDDLIAAKQFFRDTSILWRDNQAVQVVYTPMIAYVGNLGSYDQNLLDLDPVMIGPFLVGYYMKQSEEQKQLDQEWLDLLKEHGFIRTIGKWRR